MIIPKSFQNGQDFESMLLTSLLGTFIALKEDLISLKQAENYWLSEFTEELFTQLKLSQETLDLVQRGIRLKEMEQYSPAYEQALDQLIADSKQLISRYYTEYDEQHAGIIN